MKLTQIALACGLAVAAMAANAAGPAIPAGAKTIFVSGASAPDGFLDDIANGMLSGTASGTGAPVKAAAGSNYRAYIGFSKVAGQVGQPIVLMKRSAGGSAFGVNPLATGERIVNIDLNNCTLASGATQWACGTKGIDPGVAGSNTAANNGDIPDIGVSDVEPFMFQAPFNVENNQPALSSTELARLTNRAINVQMFGIVATDAVNDIKPISRTLYGNMLAGNVQDWYDVDESFDPVIVCRRVPGSGTQATYNWFFSGFPCNLNSAGFDRLKPALATSSAGFIGGAGTTADPIVIDPSLGYTVVENSGSSGVRACLTAAQNKTDFTATGAFGRTYKVEFSKLPNRGKAIGVLTLDSYNRVAANNLGWNYRMLDGAGKFYPAGGPADAVGADTGVCRSAACTGVAPSKSNLLSGKYDFAVELSIQARNTTVTNPQGDVAQPISADPVKNAFYNAFVTNAGSTRYTGNDGGSFTNTPNAFATLPTIGDNLANPAFVGFYTRDGNTCQPLKFKLGL